MSIKRVLLSIYTVCFAIAAMAQTTETPDNGMQELARRLLYAKQREHSGNRTVNRRD